MIHQLAAFVVGAKHKIFWGYLATAWLCGVILSLFLVPGFYGHVLRDVGLALGMLSFSRLYASSRNTALTPAYAVAKRGNHVQQP
jgi:hypothetical protein